MFVEPFYSMKSILVNNSILCIGTTVGTGNTKYLNPQKRFLLYCASNSRR